MGYYLPDGATQIGGGPFYFDPNGAQVVAFNRPGAYSWSYADDPAEGSVLQSDPTADNALAVARARLIASGAGQLSFRANVSGEVNYDYFLAELVLVADNSSKASYTLGNDGSKPQNTWLDGSLIAPAAGEYELRLVYRKDPSDAAGRDNARVARVTLPPELSYADETGAPGGGSDTDPGSDDTPGGAAGAVYTLQYPLRGQCWPNPGSFVLIATDPEPTEP